MCVKFYNVINYVGGQFCNVCYSFATRVSQTMTLGPVVMHHLIRLFKRSLKIFAVGSIIYSWLKDMRIMTLCLCHVKMIVCNHFFFTNSVSVCSEEE